VTATTKPVPTIAVSDDRTLARVRRWTSEVVFDTSHTAANAAGKPSVALLRDGRIVAGIVCDTPWLQRAAENICEAVLMRREDATAGATS
jgi:hypothetical protein